MGQTGHYVRTLPAVQEVAISDGGHSRRATGLPGQVDAMRPRTSSAAATRLANAGRPSSQRLVFRQVRGLGERPNGGSWEQREAQLCALGLMTSLISTQAVLQCRVVLSQAQGYGGVVGQR